MTLKIAICDDCEKDRKHMIQLLLRYAFAHECDFHIEEFQNGKELQKKYCTRDTFQIIFIDIEMPDESGIDVVYCTIKIPKVAEGNPKSCMRNFPIIADAFGISLRPQ